MELEKKINGKKVVLQERLPLRDYNNIFALTGKIDGENLRTFLPICLKMVSSWEFPGDPKDEAAWDELDIFTELLPIANFVQASITERAGAGAEVKN